MRWLLSFLILLGSTVTRCAFAEVAILPCAHDNTLFEDADGDTSNGAGPALFAGRNSQDRTRRALVAFDLLNVLPAGARIDRVELALYVSSAPDSTARSFSLHRALRGWGEGVSSSSGGAGATAAAGDATWLHARYPAELWSHPGGDFAATASASQRCGDIGPVAWEGPGLSADVEAWLADPASNHGWLLMGEELGSRTVRRFASRESVELATRPTLTIFYSRSDPVAARPASWGRLKAAYR